MRRLVIISGIALAALLRPAAADPLVGRVLTAPTAWLPTRGDAVGTAGIDHRGHGTLVVGYGLGGLAEVDLGTETDVRAAGDPLWLGRAGFRIGASRPAGLPGALVVGVRTTFAAHGHAVHEPRVSDAYVVASADFTYVRAHVGVDAIAATVNGHAMDAAPRLLAGLELRPPQYPRTTLMGDIAWEPELDPDAGPRLAWLAGWGVRYQAFDWGSIELAVRHREGEDLGGSTVLIRVNGVWQR